MRGTSVAVLVCAAGLVLTGCAGPSSAQVDQPAVRGGVTSTAGRWWVVTRVPDDPAQPTAVVVGDTVGGAPPRLSQYPRVLAWLWTVEVAGAPNPGRVLFAVGRP